MAEDLINFRLSAYANDIAEKLKDTGYFDYATTAAKFGLGYAIKNYFHEFNPATYQISDSNGSNYNVGSFDNDGQLAVLIRALYPETNTPYQYMRSLMIFGLTKLGEKIEQDGFQSVGALL